MNNFSKIVDSFIELDLMSRNTIIKIVRLQNKIIEKLTGIFYIDSKDIKSLQQLRNFDIEHYIDTLKNEIEEEDLLYDDSLSPWCTTFSCSFCPYGKNHGVCNEDGSTNLSIMNALNRKGYDKLVDIDELISGISKILKI